MKTVFKILAGIFGVVILLIAVVVGAVFVVDWSDLKGYAEEAAGGALGRKVEIGDLAVDPGWTTRVTLRDLRISNPDGMDGDFAKAATVVVVFRPWTILSKSTVFNEIRLEKPVLSAVKEKDNRKTWDISKPAEVATDVAKPEDRTEFPTIRKLIVEDGQVTYWDKVRGLKLEGTLSTVVGDGDEKGGVDLKLKGELEDRPTRLTFSGGPLEQLRRPEEPYPFDLEISVAKTKVRAKGTVTEPVEMRGFDVDFFLSGPSLAEVFPLFRIPMPHTPPYKLEGRLAREGAAWRLRDFSGKVGDSDLGGWISANYGSERPLFEGELVSQNLDIADLGGLIGGGKKTPSPKETRFLPDTPIDTERFRAANLDLKFRAKNVEGPNFPKMSLEMHARLKDGAAHIQPLSVSLPMGRVTGEAKLDTTKDPPRGEAGLFVTEVDLESLLKGTRFAADTRARVNGRINVKGRGKSFADIVGKGDGMIEVTTGKGTISGLLVEAIGLDIAESLAILVGGDGPVTLRCGRIEGRMRAGVIKLGRAAIDTTDSLLAAAGSIDLGKEKMVIQAEGHAKDFSLIDLAAPVVVRGPFSDLSVKVGVDPLPFFEMGDATNMDCKELLKPPS